jgi:tetratricopeptide (TPR) repeat protein
MVESLWLFHYNRRHYADWIDATEMGIECAHRAGHRDAEARLRTQLAWALVELRRFDRAWAELELANAMARDSDNVELRGSVREFTGTYYLKKGEHDRAIAAFREARKVAVAVESNRGVALQDYFIGWALLEKGDYGQARDPLSASLARMRRADDQMFVGRLLLRLGQALQRSESPDEAEATLKEGLKVLRPLEMRIEEAETYDELAALAEARGDSAAAEGQRERAQDIYRELGNPRAGEQTPLSPVSVTDPLTI